MSSNAKPAHGKRERKLYRREWEQTDNPIVNEARQQTLALQRLQTWMRLAYAGIAAGALLAYWGFTQGSNVALAVVGVIVAVLFFAIAMVFRIGISHGRKNVNAMLEHLEASQ